MGHGLLRLFVLQWEKHPMVIDRYPLPHISRRPRFGKVRFRRLLTPAWRMGIPGVRGSRRAPCGCGSAEPRTPGIRLIGRAGPSRFGISRTSGTPRDRFPGAARPRAAPGRRVVFNSSRSRPPWPRARPWPRGSSGRRTPRARPGAPRPSASWKPDFSATSRLISRPSRPWPASEPAWPSPLDEWPLRAGDEDALGHQRLGALRQVLGDLRQGVEPRVAERLDLPQQDRRLGQTDLHDPRAPRRGRRGCAAGSRPAAVTTVCSACSRELGQSASAVTTICSACLRARARSASPWFSAICDLHLRVGQLGLHRRPAPGPRSASAASRPPPAGARRSRSARSRAAAAAAAPAASRSCRRPRPCRACRSARRRTRCRTRGTGRRSSLAGLVLDRRRARCSSSSIVFLWATSRK